MMKKIILLFLLINVNLVAYNQIIKGTILDNETKKPIYSAAVYFNGTSVGTLSDEDGDFKLDILTFSSMPLSISAIGYYSVTLDEFSDSKPNIVYMKPKLFELNEVIVNDKSHTSERNENLTTFRDVFLGTSWNAENCEITNEDDIRFLYSSDKDTLKAFTIKPILIDNRALGYKITYYLDKFEYSKPDRIFLFTGKIFFSEDLTATGRKKKHFEKKREDAYFGSRMNFFRTLWFDDLDSAGYQVKNSANVTLDYKDIVSQKDRETKYLKYHGDLGISFGTHKPPSSIIFLKDSVLFYPNGYFDPKGITWRGEMAEQRIADLLPYEYSTSESSASSFPISPKIKMAGILNQIEKNIPSDQLYMHLDRNLYHPGDTIRFQAYIRDRKSGIMGSESISLHSLLLNQAHRTIDSARFRIANCTASGWLKIPETITPGNFSVTAFTSMMMNYDPEFVFSVPIRIDEQKNARLEMAQIADKSSSLSYQTSTIHPVIDLRFLPEGGTLIYAIPQRMAFNAVTSSGRTLKVNGEIRNQRGEKVADFSSGEFGPGLLEFTPLQGDTYFASLKGEELSGQKWPLPIPDSSGIAMRVNNNEGIINVLLEGRGVEAKAYILAITMNNSLVFSGDLRLDSLFRLSVKTEELPAGTAYITLYDNELNPVAERLIFVNYHKKMNIEISSSSSAVNSGDETELILNTTDYKGENISSIISIAVIDSTSGYSSTLPFPDIGSTFLFDRDFYNNLPMSIKVHGLNNIDKKSIDLLLMTFGWRKFNLKENPGISPDKILLDYDHLKISNLEPGKKGKLEIHVLTTGRCKYSYIAC